MVFARMSIWKFKHGQREEAFKKLDESIPRATVGSTKGFRGFLQLLSNDDPELGIIITFWESEDALKSSGKGVFRDAVRTLEQFVDSPPDVKNYRVSDAELRLG